MDNKFYVPQETAKRLKEAGYPVKQDAPITYHEAVDWLESKGLYIDCCVFLWHGYGTMEYEMRYTAHGFVYLPQIHSIKDGYQTSTYDSREEALDEAIITAIDMLNKQKQ